MSIPGDERKKAKTNKSEYLKQVSRIVKRGGSAELTELHRCEEGDAGTNPAPPADAVNPCPSEVLPCPPYGMLLLLFIHGIYLFKQLIELFLALLKR